MYKPGTGNRVADALSHRGHEVALTAISAPVHMWLDEIKASYTLDSKCQALLTKLAVSSDVDTQFKLH